MRRKERTWLVIAIVLGIACVCFRFSRLYAPFMCRCIPGDAAVTSAAWERMVCQIESGALISDCIFDFCLEILRGA